MKEIKREKMRAITVFPEDVISLWVNEVIEQGDTVDVVECRKVLEATIGQSMTLDESVIFAVEEGDFRVQGVA